MHMVVGIFLWDCIFCIFWFIQSSSYALRICDRLQSKYRGTKHSHVYRVWTKRFLSIVNFVLFYDLPVVAIAKTLEMNIITTLAFALYFAVGEHRKVRFGDPQDGKWNFGKGTSTARVLQRSSRQNPIGRR